MRKLLKEKFEESKTPDMKYYAFDWDDNIAMMPTEIILKNSEGNEVGMSTHDFAKYRERIGKENFEYKGNEIVGYSDDAFKNFRTDGDKQFLIDAMQAEQGPAFEDFKEAINNGSIFAIITARGHNPITLKKAVENYIMADFGGIRKDELLKNLRKYRSFTGEEDLSDKELIDEYLDMNKFYPVSFFSSSGAESPEELKVMSMHEFVNYIKEMAAVLNKRAWLKKDIGNEFVPEIPRIGFSDDDIKNIETMKKGFKNRPEDRLRMYSTAGGTRKEVK